MSSLVYAERNRTLIELGFPSYSHYLGSDVWKEIRRLALKGNCHCGKQATQLHHRSYAKEVLLGEDLTQLLPICNGCHKRIEFTKDGKKRSFEDCEAICKEFLALPSGEKLRTPTKPKPKCKGCGAKPRKKQDFCRICTRVRRFGVKHFPSVDLPTCQGKDCTHQAQVGKRYCRIHEVQPDLSAKEIKAFRKRAARAGVRIW